MASVVWLLKWRASGEYFKGRLNHYAFWGESRRDAFRFASRKAAVEARDSFGVGGVRLVAIVRLTRKGA